MPSTPAAPPTPYRVDELTIEDGLDIAMWSPPGPWAVQDSLQAPRADEGYWAVRAADKTLIGYCCFGEAARPLGLPASGALLDVALGLAPQLTGQRLSRDFAAAVVGHARQVAEFTTAALRGRVLERGRTPHHRVGGLRGHRRARDHRRLVVATFFVYEM